MLNGRIYRAAWLPALIAVVVAGLSLGHRPGALSTTLAPDAFDGSLAVQTVHSLAREFPGREPGSVGDDRLARQIAQTIGGLGNQANAGFRVRIHRFEGQTIDGERSLSTVVAQRPGTTGASPIVILAHRDSTSSSSPSELSGTAILLELARLLVSRETNRTIFLVSTSGGSGGDAGASNFATFAPQPVDGAVVLGDLASGASREPSVVSYSDALGDAPLELTRTVSGAIAQEFGAQPRAPSLAGQFAHLALPLATGEQGPLNARGIGTVLVQVGGERASSRRGPVDAAQLESSGRAVLSALDALDDGPDISAGAPPLLALSRETVPVWAIRLLVGALLLPVLLVALDALARVRRRRERVGRWVVWTASCAVPFFVCALFVMVLGRTGIIGASPSAPVSARAVTLDSSTWAVLVATALVFFSTWFGRSRALRRLSGAGAPASPAAGVAVLLVLTLTSVVVWLANPFTAALFVLALHLWLVLVAPELRPRRMLGVAILALGLLPAALLIVYYGSLLDAGVPSGVWITALMFAGGHWGIVAAALASVLSGGVVALALILLRGRVQETASPGVTIRGPISYAGPGSLGGTESALHR